MVTYISIGFKIKCLSWNVWKYRSKHLFYIFRSWGRVELKSKRLYREKKKQKEGESYLAKERQRRMTYYTPSSELSRIERVKRNETNSEYLRTWRQKKRDDQIHQDLEHESLENEALPTSGYESVSSSLNNSLQDRFNFHPRKKNASRVRISRALSTAHRNISKLKKDNHQLTKRTKTLQKSWIICKRGSLGFKRSEEQIASAC